ncbi:MAG: DUF1491 family protein [Alphaproteobacteria bacterium]|nr:DUF1491 family protein [Alphaproteobacteria bacterium]
MPPRLRTAFWVQVQVRRGDQDHIPVVVTHKGDEQAGTVIVKHNRLGLGCHVYARTVTAEGTDAWLAVFGPATVAEAEADAYLGRAIARDPDVWVLEVEDRDGRYELDAPVVG